MFQRLQPDSEAAKCQGLRIELDGHPKFSGVKFRPSGNAPVVSLDVLGEDFPMRGQSAEGSLLVVAHEAGVTGHTGHEDGR